MKNYKLLYSKYKNKYLKLKKQIGGRLDLYMPCEITSLTTQLYIDPDVLDRLNIGEYFDRTPISLIDNQTFCQDIAILLKKKDTNTDYVIKTKSIQNPHFNSFIIINDQFRTTNHNDYGGNFIAAPNNTIFCFDGLSQNLEEIITNRCDKLVKLQCGFMYTRSRHIDECMCFMPYGDSYKVWIYKIRNINVNSRTLFILNPNIDELIAILTPKINEIYPIINKIYTKLKAIPEENREDWQKKQYILVLSAIDAIESFKLGDYKPLVDNKHINLRYLNTTDNENIKALKNYIEGSQYNPELKKRELEAERQCNLNLISQSLFDKPYEETTDRFVHFPIDINVDYDATRNKINYKIERPPIFNRIWYETNTEAKILFPIGNDIDPIVKEILDCEHTKIKSMINPTKPIITHYINTLEYHTKDTVGGNLHCLIKNKY